MCGLSGMAGAITFKEEKIVKTLLDWGGVRGRDATGIASVTRQDEDFKLAKEIGPYYFLENTKRFDKVFSGVNYCFIGHNRSGTVGANIRSNAHPFEIEDVMGAHNGTISHGDKGRLEAGASFRTDSEAIFNNIAVHGIEDTIGRIDKSEAYALTWFDRRDHTMNFLRNSRRPLIYVRFNEGRTLAWASEYGMLRAAMGREEINTKELTYYDTNENEWYSWSIPKMSHEKLPDPKRKILKNREYVFPEKKTPIHYGTHGTDTVNTRIGPSNQAPAQESYEEDSEGYVNGGLYIGRIHKSQLPGYKEKSITEKALDRLKGAMSGTSTYIPIKGPTAEVQSHRVMSAIDVNRKRAYEVAKVGGLIPVANDDLIPFFNGHSNPNLQVWRHPSTGHWTYLRYNVVRNSWELYKDVEKHPFDMPFSILDVNARHEFRHVGRGTNKKIFYRGFNGKDLDREAFEKAMKENQCMDCQRIPEWGNKVFFFTDQDEFLCEWCERTPSLLDGLLLCNKNKAA